MPRRRRLAPANAASAVRVVLIKVHHSGEVMSPAAAAAAKVDKEVNEKEEEEMSYSHSLSQRGRQ